MRMQCLTTNQICPVYLKKCKKCKLDSCRESMILLDEQERKIQAKKIKNIIRQLPNECKKCSLYIILDVDKEKVYCPYRINKCAIK